MEKVAAGRLVNFDFLSLLLHHPKRATTSTINVCLAVLPFVDLFYICIYLVRRSFLHFASAYKHLAIEHLHYILHMCTIYILPLLLHVSFFQFFFYLIAVTLSVIASESKSSYICYLAIKSNSSNYYKAWNSPFIR